MTWTPTEGPDSYALLMIAMNEALRGGATTVELTADEARLILRTSILEHQEAAARIAELEAETIRLQRLLEASEHDGQELWEEADKLEAANAALTAERDALREDAERWRWAKARTHFTIHEDGWPLACFALGDDKGIAGLTEAQALQIFEHDGYHGSKNPEILDIALDAARKEGT